MSRRPTCAAILLVGVLAACGDPETNDDRGYTKAPLENPTLLIEGEEPSAMREYGEPKLPQREPLELPDSTND